MASIAALSISVQREVILSSLVQYAGYSEVSLTSVSLLATIIVSYYDMSVAHVLRKPPGFVVSVRHRRSFRHLANFF